MKIDYQLRSGSHAADLATADDMEMRYDAFLGDLFIRDAETNLSAPWGWIPILDFALCIVAILRQLLTQSGRAVYEFTESEEILKFHRVANHIQISSTYSSEVITCSLDEFVEAVIDFCSRLGRELGTEHPTLSENRLFVGFSNEVSSLSSTLSIKD